MIFVEFKPFNRRRAELLDDEEFRALQNVLLANPASGAVISGTGGLRKLRWSAPGSGKRGGIRVIYYVFDQKKLILLLLIYRKNEQEDLSQEQKRVLRMLVEAEVITGGNR
ncbi:MAG TPA: hypothetical protein VFQ45_23345 [Longimicrobium sp.]|nr:hypothetical protein [Longimicrobium sp.]